LFEFGKTTVILFSIPMICDPEKGSGIKGFIRKKDGEKDAEEPFKQLDPNKSISCFGMPTHFREN
jgi:hypothetical protein